MTSEHNKAIVRRWFEEGDRLEGKVPAEMFAPGFTAHVVGSPPLNAEGWLQFLAMWYTSFSDFSHSIEDMVAESDRVAVRIRAQATHTGEFMGVPATGKQVTNVYIGIARIAGGKVAEWWNCPDRLGMMQQLGLIPPPRADR